MTTPVVWSRIAQLMKSAGGKSLRPTSGRVGADAGLGFATPMRCGSGAGSASTRRSLTGPVGWGRAASSATTLSPPASASTKVPRVAGRHGGKRKRGGVGAGGGERRRSGRRRGSAKLGGGAGRHGGKRNGGGGGGEAGLLIGTGGGTRHGVSVPAPGGHQCTIGSMEAGAGDEEGGS